jgi:hypothetical protein
MKFPFLNFTSFSLVLVLFVINLSCEKLLPKKSRNISKINGALLDKSNPIYFDRIESRSKAQLSFTTTKPTFCEINLWAQDPKEAPKKENALVLSCDGLASSRKVTINNLSPDVIYKVAIYTWLKGESSRTHKPFIFSENQGGHTTIGKEIDSKNSLIIALVDLPLGVGQIRKHTEKKSVSKINIADYFSISNNCSNKKFDSSSFESTDSLLRLESLATRGYAAGSSKIADSNGGRVFLEFDKTLQRGDQWEWNYKLNSISNTFTMPAPTVFNSVKITTDDFKILDRVNLDAKLKTIALNPNGSLGVSWKPSSSNDRSRVFIQIGHSSLNKAIFCQFDASKEAITINSALLNDLPSGNHYVLIKLEYYYFNQFTGISSPSWLVSTSDWRAIKLEKL